MINQKKYFKINTLLLMLGVVLIVILGQIYRYKIEDTNKFLRIPNNLEVINLGSSHGLYSFKYPKEVKGYNLGVSAQGPYYDSMILEKYKNKLQKKAIVFIPISTFTFYKGYETERFNDSYYSFLNFEQIYNGDRNSYLLKKNFPLLYNGKSISGILKYIVSGILKRNFEPKGTTYKATQTKDEKIKDLERAVEGHLGLNEQNKTRHNQPIEIGYSALKKMIDMCIENGFIPILVTTPQTYLYNEAVGEGRYSERLYKNIEQLKSEYKNDILYWDYSHDKRFSDNLDLFFDSDHLNEKGAEMFTQIVLDELRNKGLLKIQKED